MIDQKTLAYINLYAVLGTLENLCELAPEASSLLTLSLIHISEPTD